MPVALLRADNNLPPWRPGLKEVFSFKKQFLVVHKMLLSLCSVINSHICSFRILKATLIYFLCFAVVSFELFYCYFYPFSFYYYNLIIHLTEKYQHATIIGHYDGL
jgi:hypothetical protein